jgi:hypothetical protein
MQLKDEFRTYESLRREHDAQIVQVNFLSHTFGNMVQDRPIMTSQLRTLLTSFPRHRAQLKRTLRDRHYLFVIAVIRNYREAICTKLNIWHPKFLEI